MIYEHQCIYTNFSKILDLDCKSKTAYKWIRLFDKKLLDLNKVRKLSKYMLSLRLYYSKKTILKIYKSNVTLVFCFKNCSDLLKYAL